MIRISGSQLDSEEKRDEFVNLRTSARSRNASEQREMMPEEQSALHTMRRMDKIFAFLFPTCPQIIGVTS